MNTRSTPPSSPSMAIAGSPPAICRGRPCGETVLERRKDADRDLRRHHRPADRYRFSRHRSTTFWRGCRNPMRSRRSRTSRQRQPRGPGRPKLGVVAREITLLPRHWEWLAQQPGGASVAMRKLVEQARRAGEDRDRIRAGAGSGLSFHVGDGRQLAAFRRSLRALFADDRPRFEKLIAGWPADIRDHICTLAERAFRREAMPPHDRLIPKTVKRWLVGI